MLDAAVREVTVLAAGGTIAMTQGDGGGAVPRLDADALVQAVPPLREVAGLHVRTLPDDAFDHFVVDRFDTPEGGKRLFLRPKVPFGT